MTVVWQVVVVFDIGVAEKEREPGVMPGSRLLFGGLALCACCVERLIEVGEDVIDVFDADGEAHITGGDAGGQLFGG